MAVEHLAARGQMDEWLDASQIALDKGQFTKIRLSLKDKTKMTAEYGADDIALTFEPRDDTHITLTIEASEKPILDWYKHCVRDVMKHPEKYEDYYGQEEADEAEENTRPEMKETPLDMEWLNTVKERAEDIQTVQKAKGLFPKTWFMILMLIILPPFGLFLFFRYHQTKIWVKIVTTILAVLYFLFVWLSVLGINTGFGINTLISTYQNTKKTVDTMVNGEPVKEQRTQRSDD